MSLTPKQKKILEFITQFQKKRGYAPSQLEIANHFGFKSLGTVQNYLVRLERQGLLKKSLNAHRGMEVLDPKPTQPPISHSGSVPIPQSVPLLGKVAAGRPIEAIANAEALEVPPSMLRQGEHFALQVAGDSMIEDGILDGDYVLIKKQARAEPGQTVVALIQNEATIKRFYRRPGGAVELRAANPAYPPIIVESLVQSEDFKIEGILVGVLRLYPQT